MCLECFIDLHISEFSNTSKSQQREHILALLSGEEETEIVEAAGEDDIQGLIFEWNQAKNPAKKAVIQRKIKEARARLIPK